MGIGNIAGEFLLVWSQSLWKKQEKPKQEKRKIHQKLQRMKFSSLAKYKWNAKAPQIKTPLRRKEPRKFYATKNNNHSFIDPPIRKKVKQHQVKTKRIPKMIPKMLHTKMVMKAKRRWRRRKRWRSWRKRWGERRWWRRRRRGRIFWRKKEMSI